MGNEKVFRDKSLAQMEQNNPSEDFIKVTSPRLWIVLVGIIVLLVGFIAWGFLGHIETTSRVNTVVATEDGVFFALQKTHNGMRVEQGARCGCNTAMGEDFKGTVTKVSDRAYSYQELVDMYGEGIVINGSEGMGYIVFRSDITGIAPSIFHDGWVVTESIAPMSFVFG